MGDPRWDGVHGGRQQRAELGVTPDQHLRRPRLPQQRSLPRRVHRARGGAGLFDLLQRVSACDRARQRPPLRATRPPRATLYAGVFRLHREHVQRWARGLFRHWGLHVGRSARKKPVARPRRGRLREFDRVVLHANVHGRDVAHPAGGELPRNAFVRFRPSVPSTGRTGAGGGGARDVEHFPHRVRWPHGVDLRASDG